MRGVGAWAVLLLVMALVVARPVRADEALLTPFVELEQLARPAGGEGSDLVVLGELGFDNALVRPLAERLRRRGHSVWLLSATSRADGLERWGRAVVQATAGLHRVQVVALGVGGGAWRSLAATGRVSGVVAVNVPERLRIGNVALADALAEASFQPHRWLVTPRGALLLGGGRSTPSGELSLLRRTARPLHPLLAADVSSLMLGARDEPASAVPVVRFVSVKDNLVSPEDVLLAGRGGPARRLGRLELFSRDWGHLDWLASDEGLSEVGERIAEALEALP